MIRPRCKKQWNSDESGPSLLYSVRFLLAEFLEARIIPERIEHWIEPEQRRSEWHVLSAAV